MDGFIRFNTNNFFDRDAVLNAVDAAKFPIARRQGGLVRKVAQRSMPYRKKPASPGRPPSAHKDRKRGPLLRKRLFFAWDPGSGSVVVGPDKLGDSKAPEKLEFGGTVTIRTVIRKPRIRGKLSPAAKEAFLRKVKDGSIKLKQETPIVIEKRIYLQSRSYMGPALRECDAAILEMWQDQVV